MPFYDLTKDERTKAVELIDSTIRVELQRGNLINTIQYFSDPDTYIRKSAYLSIGRIYSSDKNLRPKITQILTTLISHDDYKIRQTVINAAGEIGKNNFGEVRI